MSVKTLTQKTFALPMRQKRVENCRKNRRQIFETRRKNEQKSYKKNIALACAARQNKNATTNEDHVKTAPKDVTKMAKCFKQHQKIFKPIAMLAALASIKQENRKNRSKMSKIEKRLVLIGVELSTTKNINNCIQHNRECFKPIALLAALTAVKRETVMHRREINALHRKIGEKKNEIFSL